jgi:hypothetical protein
MIIGLSVISQQRIYQKFLDGFNDDDDKDNIVVEKADNEKEGLSSKILFSTIFSSAALLAPYS